MKKASEGFLQTLPRSLLCLLVLKHVIICIIIHHVILPSLFEAFLEGLPGLFATYSTETAVFWMYPLRRLRVALTRDPFICSTFMNGIPSHYREFG